MASLIDFSREQSGAYDGVRNKRHFGTSPMMKRAAYGLLDNAICGGRVKLNFNHLPIPLVVSLVDIPFRNQSLKYPLARQLSQMVRKDIAPSVINHKMPIIR